MWGGVGVGGWSERSQTREGGATGLWTKEGQSSVKSRFGMSLAFCLSSFFWCWTLHA